MPKGLRELQGLVLLAHGPKVLTALQALFRIGTDEGEEAKVRVAALGAFVNQVGNLTGLSNLGKSAAATEETSADEGELLDRVVTGLLAKPETRAMVATKLTALDGGKK